MYLEWFSFIIMCGKGWGEGRQAAVFIMFPKMLSCQQAECRTGRHLTVAELPMYCMTV